MIAGPWFVTPHAVARYRARVAPGQTYEQALGALVHQSAGARRVKPWARGLVLYRGPRPLRLRFLVDETARPFPALVTLYGGHDRWRPPTASDSTV